MLFVEFTQALIEDIEQVFSSPSFRNVAQSSAAAIETNRQALTAALRHIPGVVRLAKRAMHQQEPAQGFLIVHTGEAQDHTSKTEIHPDVEQNEAYHEAHGLLVKRAKLYTQCARAQRCALMLLSDGTEGIALSWTPNHDDDQRCIRYTSWSTPVAPSPLPHDLVGFLVGTGMLYDAWSQGATTHPSFTSVRDDMTTRLHHALPQQAAALNAVERWPVVFAADPQELAQPLSDLISEPFVAND